MPSPDARSLPWGRLLSFTAALVRGSGGCNYYATINPQPQYHICTHERSSPHLSLYCVTPQLSGEHAVLTMGQPKKNTGKPLTSTFHYCSYTKDTITVQKGHSDVNDSKVYEANSHLEDFLVPHHIANSSGCVSASSTTSTAPS